MDNSSDAASKPFNVPKALLEAEDAARDGDLQRAYRLSLEATQVDTENLKGWLLRAETAPSFEETVICLNQANTLWPFDPDVKQKTYQLVQKLLEQDPFLLYLDETDDLYHVCNSEQLSLIVSKDRSVPEAYPTRRPPQLQSAYRWLWAALLGLPLAGIGGIVFTPLAAVAGVSLYRKTSSKTNRIYSLVVIILSGGLWLVGLLLGVILLVHLV